MTIEVISCGKKWLEEWTKLVDVIILDTGVMTGHANYRTDVLITYLSKIPVVIILERLVIQY